MKIVDLATSSLVPYANNSRTHSDTQIEQICASIREFGFTNPVLVDGDSGIIAGHGRVLAAELLEMDTVPCIILDYLTEVQKRAYVIADNKLAENSGWDEEMLRLELDDLSNVAFDLNLTGFENEEVLVLFDLGDKGGNTDPDDVPEPPAEATTKPGDVWRLGNHTLICGDCTELGTMQKLMGDSKADLLLTDPPYGIDYEGRTKDKLKVANDALETEEFIKFLSDCFMSANSVMRPGASFYIWHANNKSFEFFKACQEELGEIRQVVVWIKNNSTFGRQDYHWKHEPCIYGWKEGAGHRWSNDRKQTTLLEFDKPLASKVHPTMKPVEMMNYQINNNTIPEDIVLDLFGGSGSTLIACEQSGRFCRMIELSPIYCDVIIERWEAFTGRTAELEG